MTKNILITGATDGIGLETAKTLAAKGHNLLIHGRNAAKLSDVEKTLSAMSNVGTVESFVADLTDFNDVAEMANAVKSRYSNIDVLLNNAGVFRMADPITKNDMDARFVVNTISPYLLTQGLLPIMDASSRIVNLSSAAQAPVNLEALLGKVKLIDEFEAYAQSKLAITMWTRALAKQWGDNGPMIVAVNPGSMLASKMVKEGFGVAGNDLSIGVDILVRAALSEEFADASGKYFDNDARRFASPHPEGLNDQKSLEVIKAVESVIGT
ncbi:SDR family NAD(P)-dependent oxidoreductase [Enterovibrio norvegicus]|uniref:SDR family NAD(P)-dependent oxidoreductase n=1 Tax=Enterovibrio norvegicus TaxID=188144 RepID=UPI003D10FEBB